METKISASNIIDLLTSIKRDIVSKGPYKNVTFFEAANRIMTDLVILYGVKDLLSGKYPNIIFPEYVVEFGNENKNPFDIMAEYKEERLIGEAFNVSKSFFQGKKSTALKKLNHDQSIDDKTIRILMYNRDAVEIGFSPKYIKNLYHIVVDIIL